MIFANLARIAKARIDRRRRYARIVAEIQDLSQRDLTDMGADRSDMLRRVYREFYGK